MIVLKSDREIGLMREANRIVAVVLQEIGERIRPGVSTQELDRWAEERILSLRARPAFKGIGGQLGKFPYPATLCTSLNQEVVHGIPSPERRLREGDILSIDVGTVYEGYYGDGAWTYSVGDISPEAQRLLRSGSEALAAGIGAAREGQWLNRVSQAIERCVRGQGFEIVRDLSGHGIGRVLWEEPTVFNFDDGQRGPRLKRNMTLAIEPMITAGGWEVRTLADGWTVVTADGSLAAHFEHTVVITADGADILTRC